MRYIDVICPHCQAKQQESPDAISTYCQSCGEHFSLIDERKVRLVRHVRTNRWITCRGCGYRDRIPESALSAQCSSCGVYLDLSNHCLTKSSSQKIETYGRVEVDKICSYRSSCEMVVGSLRVAGQVCAVVHADTLVTIESGALLKGKVVAEQLVVKKKGQVKSSCLEVDWAEIDGRVEVGELHVSKQLKVGGDAVISSQNIWVDSIQIAQGAQVEGHLRSWSPKTQKSLSV